MDDKGKPGLIIGGGAAAGAVPADKLDAIVQQREQQWNLLT
jgi:hypothetical protein